MNDWKTMKIDDGETGGVIMTAMFQVDGSDRDDAKVSFGVSSTTVSADVLRRVQEHVVAIVDLLA